MELVEITWCRYSSLNKQISILCLLLIQLLEEFEQWSDVFFERLKDETNYLRKWSMITWILIVDNND